LNPVLLRSAIRNLSEPTDFTFASIGKLVETCLASLRAVAVRGWSDKSFDLFGEKIELPLLDLDYAEIAAFRDAAT
ncbi:MAG: hypothetical protein ACP5RC_12970, partial [Halothiobacillaceae bacterium]